MITLAVDLMRGDHLLELWKQAGTLEKVCGFLQSKGYNIKEEGLWWRIYTWAIWHPDIAHKKYFSNMDEMEWRYFLMRKANYLLHYSKWSFRRWLITNPWSLEPMYQKLWRFYFTEREIDAIRQSANNRSFIPQ